MKVFMVGGTGLLGAEAAKQLIAMGHSVSTVALPPLPEGANIPTSMNIHFGDINKMSDQQILQLMSGCKSFVFAAGVDERIEFDPPVYNSYKKYNIDPINRLMPLAKQAGITKTVVFGSYFTYFDRTMPKLNLYENHPYIKSRVDQLNAALSFADDKMTVAVLEIPYVFGAQRGRKPVWTFYVDMLNSMPKTIFYPKGGTTMVTVKQIGQAVVGAITNNIKSKPYPVGWYNKTWVEMLTVIKAAMQQEHKKIKTIPTFLYKLNSKKTLKNQIEEDKETGLHPVEFVKLMTAKTFIDKHIIETELGVQPDDIDKAIAESIAYSVEIKDKNKHVLNMKAN